MPEKKPEEKLEPEQKPKLGGNQEERMKLEQKSALEGENGEKPSPEQSLEADSRSRARSRKAGHSRRHCHHGRILITATALVVTLVAGVCIIRYGFPPPIQARLDILPDRHAQKGSLKTGRVEEVMEGAFRVAINQLPTMEQGTEQCNIQYENPAQNHYSARVSLYMEETGKLLGNTTRIDPGYYIEQIHLKQKLSTGEYPVTARIELFENKFPAGEVAVSITLRVIETQGGETG